MNAGLLIVLCRSDRAMPRTLELNPNAVRRARDQRDSVLMAPQRLQRNRVTNRPSRTSNGVSTASHL